MSSNYSEFYPTERDQEQLIPEDATETDELDRSYHEKGSDVSNLEMEEEEMAYDDGKQKRLRERMM